MIIIEDIECQNGWTAMSQRNKKKLSSWE